MSELVRTGGNPEGREAKTAGEGGLRNDGGGGRGTAASPVVPEKERVQARDRAVANVEEHLKVLFLFSKIFLPGLFTR